ncbi:MAG: histidine utilization repressor [Gammaproteobacteria bacterium]|nr:histidine utilization repressor [Gammaproteobacteria bacterium]
MNPGRNTAPADPAMPRYQQLKAYIVGSIQAGELGPGDRAPSELELVRRFGVSRMTANRALCELASDGVVVRQAGVGTFVADAQSRSHALDVRNIADEIRERGHAHRARVVLLEKAVASRDTAARLRLRPGGALFHSLIIHFENDLPVQAEDRYVSAHAAPDYLRQDFSRITPNEYLSRAAPLQTVEHVIRAEVPAQRIRSLLKMPAHEPCLVIHRRTWSGGRPVSIAALHHPGARYELTAGAQPEEGPTGRRHPGNGRTRRGSR